MNENASRKAPVTSNAPDASLLSVQGLTKTFDGKTLGKALDEVTFDLHRGESIALVGESGSGKSTIARIVSGLETATEGSIVFDGAQIVGARPKSLLNAYRRLQMVFQNPVASFNPRRRLGSSIVDGAMNAGVPKAEAGKMVPSLLEKVGLDADYAARYPSQVSGGECQRAAIARAIAFSPELLICDECTSALDVNVQAQIVALLNDLKREEGLSLLLICHDLSLIQKLCRKTIVLLRGTIVETGDTASVVSSPMHPYTQLMIDSVFPARPEADWSIPAIATREDETDDGCRFYARCGNPCVQCAHRRPPVFQVPETAGIRCVACWKYEGEAEANENTANETN